MTALPLRDFTDAERAKLEAIEAAPAAEESVRERVALAAHHVLSRHGDCPCGQAGRLDCEDVADAALAVLSGPSSDADAASPCPTRVREGGPYRCCSHCDTDPVAHESGQRNHHDLPCTICVRAAIAGPPC